MASLTRWTWVWVNSGSWWWTGRPGVLWFMGSQRVGQDWTTELNLTEETKIGYLQFTVNSSPGADLYLISRNAKPLWFNHRVFNAVPCAIKQELAVYPLSRFHFACANPKPPIHPSITPSDPVPPWQPPVYSLCPWGCFCFTDRFLCVILLIPHINDIIWYLSFSFWLILLSMIISICKWCDF